ncbi:hypothetical protein X924_01470 [Petrotoga sp. 9PWA.NaAc.5.4]|nr:hypothetical protein X924_01470 [Petrotoga sp. 9PWA.NaAc.5.4]
MNKKISWVFFLPKVRWDWSKSPPQIRCQIQAETQANNR